VLGLRARVHGVRYPEEGKAALTRAGIIEYVSPPARRHGS
jgi:hypothetical protein